MRTAPVTTVAMALYVALGVGMNAQARSQAWPVAIEDFAAAAGPDVVTQRTADVKPPQALTKVQPKMPRESRRPDVNGKVELFLLVGADGAVKNVQVHKPLDPVLDAEAISAAAQWTFTPAIKDGAPVEMAVQMEMAFAVYPGRR